MRKIEFKDTEEFGKEFKEENQQITDLIYEGIKEALLANKKTARLFEVHFTEVKTICDISLPGTQWEKALEKCLEIYTKLGESDKAIDTYLVKKKLNEQVNSQ